MFGDVGHAGMLLLFSLFLVFANSKIDKYKSALAPVMKGRYLLLLMSIFGVYNGFIYNEFFAIPMEFDSCYTNNRTPDGSFIAKDPKADLNSPNF